MLGTLLCSYWISVGVSSAQKVDDTMRGTFGFVAAFFYGCMFKTDLEIVQPELMSL